MSNINNLTSKIIEDANNAAKNLIEEARNKEKKLIEKKIFEAEKEKEIIISKAQSEAKSRGERIISNAQLQVRNMKLQVKGEMLNSVFEKALEELKKISKEDHLKFIKNSILSMDIDGDEDIIVGKDNDAVTPDFISELNKALIVKGKRGELKLSSEKRDIEGGYILSKGGIEINSTFDTLIMSSRDELEAEVMGALFS
ncbi:V-type ATP synthase subunit E [Clostridium brassicae]|uniref:V-type proton ATPase subunit E n=1 Tax=Clostridium brassicae TaxID=2999072 RepID=A0ABT4D9P9_9CLOT|nr:V-type ATP synthase subunit E family protein [Clostridium brassicae]MCY6959035.1 V-type ATP synthase subunit E family protein [Clostridium brassicae]